MGYIELTKKTNEHNATIVIRIGHKTLLMFRKLFPGKKNESAAQYFYRLAGYIRDLKYWKEYK